VVSLSFTVVGTPAPQGSKRHVGRGILVESSKLVAPWREAVKWAALQHRVSFDGPLRVELRFLLARPKGHYGSGRNAGQVRESAPLFPAARPDIDKLARSTLDGLCESGLIRDDSQIVSLHLEKRYATREAGCLVTVEVA
jgi:crossover junction endodeoxyribonuclease RusA